MENKQMYVITMDQGQYEDAFTTVLFVTDDFQKGEAYVNKQNSVYQSCKEKAESFHKNDLKEWFLANPRPNIQPPNLLPVPKWKGNEKITSEMRANRKHIQTKNEEIIAQANASMVQWVKEQQKFTSEWLKNHLTEEEYEMYSKLNDNCWNIEPVAWL
jgi:Neuraminidase (sialidase)